MEISRGIYKAKRTARWRSFLLKRRRANGDIRPYCIRRGRCPHRPARRCRNKKQATLLDDLLYGAGNEARTRYLHLGKVALYQMSYARVNSGYNTTVAAVCQQLFQNFHVDFSVCSPSLSASASASSAGPSSPVSSSTGAAGSTTSGAGASSRNSTRPTVPSSG